MPSYKKSLIFCFLLIFFVACSSKSIEVEKKEESKVEKKLVEVKVKNFELENEYIILALEMESQGYYFDAKDFYLELFKKTNNYEYLEKFLAISTQLKDYETVKNFVQSYYLSNIKQEEILLRLYTFSLFKLENQQEALLNGEKLINLFPRDVNYELVATIYVQEKKYEKAYELFGKAFELNKSVSTFANLTNIQYFHLSQKHEAIKKIEEFVKVNGYDFNLSMQLLSFYDKEELDENIVPVLKEMYFDFKNKNLIQELSKTKILLVKYLAKDNVGAAIEFLEENKEEDEILLNLYRITNQPQKAYTLLGDLYDSSKNLDYLAQQAIIQFEMAEDKTKVVNDVIAKLERVSITNNPIFENYLAYIYIDYNINLKRGVFLVKKALEQDPKNIAFLDTLAWGEYKLKNCKEAFKQMKKVIDEVGLDDAEIKMHWHKIKECKK